MQSSDYERRLFSQRNSPAVINSTRSPNVTPTKTHGDRFIPIRQSSDLWSNRFSAIQTPDVGPPEFKRPASTTRTPQSSHHTSSHQTNNSPNSGNNQTQQTEDNRQDQLVVRALIRNELMEDRIDDMGMIKDEQNDTRSPAARNLFSYTHKTPTKYGEAGTSLSSTRIPLNSSPSVFPCPLSEESQRLLKSPRKPQRKVPKNPYKVLDAPELQDDFYLNLVDWSSQNMLSVGLNTCVYLWSACNSQVIKLCDLSNEQDTVTSVQWTDKGEYLAVGTNRGVTQIWDVHQSRKIVELPGHTSRIGCLAWNGDQICSGSRDRTILIRDIRAPGGGPERKLQEHRQEVCGLKWSPDRQYLASGGNDNQLVVWGHRRDQPVHKWSEHNAAVKALAWSPHHHGLLVSGGGTADRCLRFWNTLTGQPMQCIDTGSQVCNVAWSKHSSELVSTHGYSYNQVIIWKYPTLTPVTKLTGHQFRVLYLAMSPDGEAIVTGAGDETLRFWHVFSKSGHQKTARSKLNLFNTMR